MLRPRSTIKLTLGKKDNNPYLWLATLFGGNSLWTVAWRKALNVNKYNFISN